MGVPFGVRLEDCLGSKARFGSSRYSTSLKRSDSPFEQFVLAVAALKREIED